MDNPDFSFEKRYWKKGCKYVAGVDEVGRGSFAGPVVAAAVVFLPDSKYKFPLKTESGDILVNDSKKLTPIRRQEADKWIRENALSWGIGLSSVSEINGKGMAKATRTAFRRAVYEAKERMGKNIDFLLLDAFFIPYIKGIPSLKKVGKRKKADGHTRQLAIVNGDEKSLSIAAASIIAKVYRDRLMNNLGKKPGYKIYKWDKNKGYGTKEHLEAIREYGISKHHRKAFVQTYLTKRRKGI